jgi:hypothetical protein
MLPIIWNEPKQKWCVYDADGKELWSSVKYSDAVDFASDYAAQNIQKATSIHEGLK